MRGEKSEKEMSEGKSCKRRGHERTEEKSTEKKRKVGAQRRRVEKNREE